MSGSGEAKLPSGLPNSASPTSTSISRVAIPRFSTRSTAVVDGRGMINSSDNTNGTRTRSQRKPNNKGKEPIRGDGALSPFERDTSHYDNATSCSSSQPSVVEGLANGRSKFRGSLIAASDVLSFKFGRRKPSVRQPPRPIILPGVIEISASRQDEEVEERNRLREMAAQAIGLGPFMVSQDSESREESTTDEEVEDQIPSSDNNEIRHLSYPRSSESTPNIAVRSPHDSNLSETIPAQSSAGRLRSGSMLVHSPTKAASLTPVPSFPSTVSALASFRQSGGVYPKYYPPSSLRIFALSKSWKSRFLVLSSPETLVTRGQGPVVSYLHLFKSSSPDERELERLEINEESVVFVAEEEVGGRRQVIKVGGADVGAMKKEYNYEEGGYTLWLLQITDQAEAQQWISNIKNAILGQRTVRAGLTPGHTLGKNEPRGDMDVMLSIRAQGLVTSPIPKPRSTHSTSTQTPQDRHYASSISSHSATSQRTSSKIAGVNGPVSALKGLFTASARPRSGSRATSVDLERKQEREVNDESFTGIRSLLGILRPNTPDTQVSTPIVRVSNLPFSGPVDPIDCRIDRKILTEPEPVQWATVDQPLVNRDRANRALSLGGLPLQPPPRKRRTATRPVSEFSSLGFPGIGEQPNGSATQVNDSSVPESGSGLSIGRAEKEPPYTHQLSTFHIAPEHKSRAPSLRSVSTVNSDLALHIERSNSSTKRNSGPRRWSRQGILPTRLTPPSEPPPAIPGNHSTLGLHPYAAERTPSPTPSHNSQTSVISTLPSFSKRASGSSARSVNSYDAARSYSTATGASSMNCAISVRSTSSHRSSMPPPRPPPTVALPPAPVQAPQDTPTPSEAAQSQLKPSFRNSVTQRAFRLSTTAPKPPPSTQLPPRPDEPGLKTHRRSSSGGYGTQGHSTKLETISGSPLPSPKSVSPFPPPAGPLPPTPPITLSSSPQLPPVKQPSSSIKQRLRMLSAPLPSASQSQNISNQPQELTTNAASPIFSTPPPATPIAEKITLFQNDPSFLQMHTPTLPSQSLNLSLVPSPSEETAGITSLSPPPRRGSKQLLESELESPKPKRVAVPDEALLTVGGEPKHLSLSRPGSMMSINISARWQTHETDSESSPLDVTPSDEPLEELPEEVPEEVSEEVSEEKSALEPRHLSLSRPGSVLSLGIMAL